MNRCPWMASVLMSTVISAWWNAWDDLWQAVSDSFDPDYQRDVRSQDRNSYTDDHGGGGNFYSAGCGSDGE